MTGKIKSIREGAFYVNEEKGYVREIRRVDEEGMAHWRAYFLFDGSHAWPGACSIGHIIGWADREATEEEIASLSRRDAEVGEFEETSDLVFRFLPDEALLAEVERRGLSGG